MLTVFYYLNLEKTFIGNKISIISFSDKIGLVIESKQIVDTQRMILKLAWMGADQYN